MVQDQISGRYYYYNIETEECTWERPYDHEIILDNILPDTKTEYYVNDYDPISYESNTIVNHEYNNQYESNYSQFENLQQQQQQQENDENDNQVEEQNLVKYIKFNPSYIATFEDQNDDEEGEENEEYQYLQYSKSSNSSFQSLHLPTISEEDENNEDTNNISVSNFDQKSKSNENSNNDMKEAKVKSSFASAALKHIRRTSIIKESNNTNIDEDISPKNNIELDEGYIDASMALALADSILQKNNINIKFDENNHEVNDNSNSNNSNNNKIIESTTQKNIEENKNNSDVSNKTKVINI